MVVSNQLIEAIGYRKMTAEESITAEFFSLCTFKVTGLYFKERTAIDAAGIIDGVAYRVALGSSVNALSQLLIGENLVEGEDEEDWAERHKCSAPYLMINIGPSNPHTVTEGYIQFDGNNFSTHDCFNQAKEEIKKYELTVLPNVLTALACSFSEIHDLANFRRIERNIYGKTLEGKTFKDIRFAFSGSGSTITALDELSAAKSLNQATLLASEISPKISKFFELALEEEDLLKRFLYFFLTVERQTHSTFGSLDIPESVYMATKNNDKVGAEFLDFLTAQSKKWTTLSDRFVWCAISVWTHLTNDDVQNFKKIKGVRDKLAHGEIATPSMEDVMSVERLAKKLQLALLK